MYTPSNTIRTAAELWKLKQNWVSDPCWDIETTEGYEAHDTELYQYRLLWEMRWKVERGERVREYAKRTGASVVLAEHLMALEHRIEALENRGK